MAFDRKYIKHLDVMADLANAAPTPSYKPNIRELLADDMVKETGVDEKILSLCSRLRQEGFNKQADGIESKFLIYKSAAVHLYNTHDETGEDVINFAHPDGDNAICDAGMGLGDVETILSRHKKMVDVVTKEPKGKLASKKNSKITKKADVVIADIGKKFKYMADYIQDHALTNMPEGSTISPEQRQFYGAAALWHQVANLIATELNSPASLPERDAVQLVKNRLQNNQNEVINQHADQVNSVADIDKLVNEVLSRIVDKNPNKMASKLSSYVDECKQILKTSQLGMLGGPVGIGAEAVSKIIDPLKMLGDLAQRAEALESKLTDLSADEDAIRFPKLMEKIHAMKPLLEKALNIEVEVQSLLTNSKNKSKAIQVVTTFYTQLQATLNELNSEVKNTYRHVENSIGSKIYHLMVLSNFKWVSSAIKSLNASISEVLDQLSVAASSTSSPGSNATTPIDTSFDLSREDVPSNIDTAIMELNSWIPKINDPAGLHAKLTKEQKQMGLDFIQKHIQDIKANANDPAKIQELLKESAKFKKDWRL